MAVVVVVVVVLAYLDSSRPNGTGTAFMPAGHVPGIRASGSLVRSDGLHIPHILETGGCARSPTDLIPALESPRRPRPHDDTSFIAGRFGVTGRTNCVYQSTGMAYRVWQLQETAQTQYDARHRELFVEQRQIAMTPDLIVTSLSAWQACRYFPLLRTTPNATPGSIGATEPEARVGQTSLGKALSRNDFGPTAALLAPFWKYFSAAIHQGSRHSRLFGRVCHSIYVAIASRYPQLMSLRPPRWAVVMQCPVCINIESKPLAQGKEKGVQ